LKLQANACIETISVLRASMIERRMKMSVIQAMSNDRPTVYVASKVVYAPMWRRLRNKGANIISSWIYEAGEGESGDLADLASRCIYEAKNCEVLVFFAEHGDRHKGALVEVGAALAGGALIRFVGDQTGLPKTFIHSPRWEMWHDLELALMTPLPD
jgi:hypothetical protein